MPLLPPASVLLERPYETHESCFHKFRAIEERNLDILDSNIWEIVI